MLTGMLMCTLCAALLTSSHNKIGTSESLNAVQPDLVTGGEAIADMLTENCTLLTLDVAWNSIRYTYMHKQHTIYAN
jgi:hypothetical protein